ncbi:MULTISPECIES: type II toxin-antitoxin system VapC family toxin [unclassified Methylobacterium]|uniref:type II toxin-antitoxin system VapC family toxin n=1 Tax=unclassified Methylobacterium TaxID=2615210 RepID=UPI0011C1FF16|nr:MULTISPECIES: type II toxin-antitoxin system VapC family toxin [unclassified Methylobacterium]QEE39005.1 type II toxin-antitoxin system VapC family toxin [Methylobacterium sp. WL1]TXN54624.1 type II toxin-antitoxin system VapC family toxin [Methylobacterium sp. WL2]
MIILDTNVLSELMRAKPTIFVLKWFAAQPSAGLFTTTLTQAEIFYGLSLLPEGRRRDDLFAAAQPIFEVELAGRILSFDQDAAMAYADIAASRRRAGQPISQIDGQIAAITASRGARLATRNVRDFVDCGIVVVDPWMTPN